jgi:hypothetical protein
MKNKNHFFIHYFNFIENLLKSLDTGYFDNFLIIINTLPKVIFSMIHLKS